MILTGPVTKEYAGIWFIPQLEKTPKQFWTETRELAKKQHGEWNTCLYELMINRQSKGNTS